MSLSSVPRTSGGAPDWRKQRIQRAEAWVAARREAGLELEKAPRPDGIMPIDSEFEVASPLVWTGERWQAWQLLHEGHSSRVVAEMMNRRKDTITEWRSLWYIRYGTRITVSRHAQTKADRRYKLAPDPSSPEIRRDKAAEELDEVGAQVVSTVQRYLRMMGDDADRLMAMSPKEAGDLLSLGQRVFELSAQLQSGQGIAPRAGGIGADSSARAALTGLSGGRKRGSKSIDPAAASGGLTSLKGTLQRYQDARRSHDDESEPAAG